MLSSSDCESLHGRASCSRSSPTPASDCSSLRLGYTEVPGSAELRAAVAGGYERVEPEDVLTLAAAEEGIFIAYHALLGPGDHAVVEAPCYGSAIEVARSTGAEVSLWRRRYEDGWAHDLDALERLLRADTRLIYINSPHNPTGTQMPRRGVRRACVELARERSIVLFSDEVYRGLEHDPARPPAGRLRRLRARDLAGHRVEGLRPAGAADRLARRAASRELLERDHASMKLYTTICSSAPSELLVALALRHGERPGRAQPRAVLAQPAAARRLPRAPRASCSSGCGRPPDRSASRACAASADVQRWCEQTAERAGVLLLPGLGLRAAPARALRLRPREPRRRRSSASTAISAERRALLEDLREERPRALVARVRRAPRGAAGLDDDAVVHEHDACRRPRARSPSRA